MRSEDPPQADLSAFHGVVGGSSVQPGRQSRRGSNHQRCVLSRLLNAGLYSLFANALVLNEIRLAFHEPTRGFPRPFLTNRTALTTSVLLSPFSCTRSEGG